jgi:hypothetical protein
VGVVKLIKCQSAQPNRRQLLSVFAVQLVWDIDSHLFALPAPAYPRTASCLLSTVNCLFMITQTNMQTLIIGFSHVRQTVL